MAIVFRRSGWIGWKIALNEDSIGLDFYLIAQAFSLSCDLPFNFESFILLSL
jgi:hypothetical protein